MKVISLIKKINKKNRKNIKKKLEGKLIIESKGELIIYTQTNGKITKIIKQNSFIFEKRIPKKISQKKLNNLIALYIFENQLQILWRIKILYTTGKSF